MLVFFGYVFAWFAVSVFSALVIQYNEQSTTEGTVKRATEIFIFPYKVVANLVNELKAKL